MNVSNGGLIAQLHDNLYVCDLSEYSGTHILSADGVSVWNMKAVMWFAVPDGQGVYCSDQRNFDFLTYLDGNSMEETCVLKRACANLIKSGDTILFLDEEDGFVYEYDPAKKKSSLVIKEKAYSFILNNNVLYFAAESGLKCFNLRNKRTEKLKECVPICLNFSSEQLIFADKNQDFALCRFDISQNKLVVLDDIQTQSIITSEEYIFASNLADSNSIVRVDINTGESIRFCGESADKLHIVGEHLYFLNQNDNNSWYRVPFEGGRPVALSVSR